jgi:hypothetical protein
MKKLVLAAIAVLSLGLGFAHAGQTVTRNGVVLWGPATPGPTFGLSN